MDRPEDVEANPVSGKIYAALTNNTNRGVEYPADEANPVSVNRHGYVLEITERGGDHAGTAFSWICSWSAATRRRRRPTSPASTRTRSARSAAPTTSPSTGTATCGSPPTATRSAPTTASSGCRCPARAWSGPAVPLRALRRRDLRPADQRRPAPAFVAVQHPGEIRRHLREPRQHLAAHRPVPAAVRGGGVPRLTPLPLGNPRDRPVPRFSPCLVPGTARYALVPCFHLVHRGRRRRAPQRSGRR